MATDIYLDLMAPGNIVRLLRKNDEKVGDISPDECVQFIATLFTTVEFIARQGGMPDGLVEKLREAAKDVVDMVGQLEVGQEGFVPISFGPPERRH